MEEKDLWRDANYLVEYADSVIDKPSVHKDNDLELVVAGLFTKMLDGSNALLILLRKGYSIEAEIIGRSILEVLFYMGACLKSKKALNYYMGSSAYQRLYDIELVLKRHRHFNLDKNTIYTLQKNKDMLEKEIKARKLKRLNVRKAADVSGLFSLYLGYRTHCDAVHTDPMFLEKTFMKFNDNSINRINIGPKTIRTKDVLLTLNVTLVYACKWYSELFKIDEDKGFAGIAIKYIGK